MNTLRSSSLLAILCLVASCSDGSSGSTSSGGTTPMLTNLGVAAVDLVGAGNLFVCNVSERAGGHLDLNGDGDAEDLVVHVFDVRSGQLENTRLASGPAPSSPAPADAIPPARAQVNESLAFFVVDEASQGSTDLNGDGDAEDAVLFAFDPASSTPRNLGYAVAISGPSGLTVTERYAAFAVREFAQGETDMNGDGDATDEILHVLDLQSSIVTGILTALSTVEFAIAGEYVAYTVSESVLLGDENGDGDATDHSVLQVYDARSGSFTNTNLATAGLHPFFSGGAWLFLVNEAEQGNADRNGDLDTDDYVYHTFDPVAGVVRNLALSSSSFYAARATDELVSVVIEERGMGRDLNGDGDQVDAVPFLVEPRTGRTTSTGLALGPQPAEFVGDWLAVPVPEASQGQQDLDGDGDVLDLVAHVVDLATGLPLNLGIDGPLLFPSERFLLIERFEAENASDWNGDGDQDDAVFFAWDALTHTVSSMGRSNGGLIGVLGSTALIISPEASEGRDINGDGDISDVELAAVDLVTGASVEIALSAAGGLMTSEHGALIRVFEDRQGQDLDGDGDMDDTVLFRVEF